MPVGTAAGSLRASPLFAFLYPTGIFPPEPYHTASRTPPGYPVAHPSCPFGPSGPSGPFASATPPLPARRRCHQTARATPAAQQTPVAIKTGDSLISANFHQVVDSRIEKSFELWYISPVQHFPVAGKQDIRSYVQWMSSSAKPLLMRKN